jgi:hypothetical protein
MIEVKTIKEPDGWRVAIVDGKQTVVLSELYDDEADARMGAATML